LNDSVIIDHGDDFTPTRKKRKTYYRFLGMIFFGAVCSALVLEAQRLATQEIPENRKNAKKNVKYSSSDPCFSAKDSPF
jgi:hypothetical protein